MSDEWITIRLDDEDLIGKTIEKGSGWYKKEYVYIKIPKGYGYDNYCFLLSKKCIVDNYIDIAENMNIELIYDNDFREAGKRYARYKFSGKELQEKIFELYEDDCYAIKEKKHADKIKRNKEKLGNCICGIYQGNNSLFDHELKYRKDDFYTAYFRYNNRYSNQHFSRVENVKVIFSIDIEISKNDFDELEKDINKYLGWYGQLEKNANLGISSIDEIKEITTTLCELSKKGMEETKKALENMIKNFIKNTKER